jgi:hypothetical protein
MIGATTLPQRHLMGFYLLDVFVDYCGIAVMPTVTSIDEGGTDYLYWVNSVEKSVFQLT